MPPIETNSAPGIVRAISLPAAGRMRGSRSPWMTTDGAAISRSLRVRSPEAVIA